MSELFDCVLYLLLLELVEHEVRDDLVLVVAQTPDGQTHAEVAWDQPLVEILFDDYSHAKDVLRSAAPVLDVVDDRLGRSEARTDPLLHQDLPSSQLNLADQLLLHPVSRENVLDFLLSDLCDAKVREDGGRVVAPDDDVPHVLDFSVGLDCHLRGDIRTCVLVLL